MINSDWGGQVSIKGLKIEKIFNLRDSNRVFSEAEGIWAKSGRYEQIDALEEHRLFSIPAA